MIFLYPRGLVPLLAQFDSRRFLFPRSRAQKPENFGSFFHVYEEIPGRSVRELAPVSPALYRSPRRRFRNHGQFTFFIYIEAARRASWSPSAADRSLPCGRCPSARATRTAESPPWCGQRPARQRGTGRDLVPPVSARCPRGSSSEISGGRSGRPPEIHRRRGRRRRGDRTTRAGAANRSASLYRFTLYEPPCRARYTASGRARGQRTLAAARRNSEQLSAKPFSFKFIRVRYVSRCVYALFGRRRERRARTRRRGYSSTARCFVDRCCLLRVDNAERSESALTMRLEKKKFRINGNLSRTSFRRLLISYMFFRLMVLFLLITKKLFVSIKFTVY